MKLGQKLVCIRDAGRGDNIWPYPKKGDKVTYDGLSERGSGFYQLIEYADMQPFGHRNAFNGICFAPIDESSCTIKANISISKDLVASPDEVSDMPVKQPAKL